MDSPNEFDRLVAEGLAASRAEQRESAVALFTQASELEPGSGIPHFLIGSEQASAGDFAAAELAFARAVLLAPGLALARYQLGLLQFSSQRVPVALLTWQPLLSLPDEDALPHFVRGFIALAQDVFDEALRHFCQGLACQPANPALCADILQLVEAVQKLPAGPRVQSREEEPAGHVLLAAYTGRLH